MKGGIGQANASQILPLPEDQQEEVRLITKGNGRHFRLALAQEVALSRKPWLFSPSCLVGTRGVGGLSVPRDGSGDSRRHGKLVIVLRSPLS